MGIEQLAQLVPLVGAIMLVLTGIAGGARWLYREWKYGRDEATVLLVPSYSQLVRDLQEQIDGIKADLRAEAGQNKDCRERIAELAQQLGVERGRRRALEGALEDHRLMINGWIVGYEILRLKFEELGVTPPWAPPGPLLPRDGGG